MDAQVSEAALALVRPTTDQATRAAASKFLEEWNRTPAAWETFLHWTGSFANNDNGSQESVGSQLLCLQLLQRKIRAELPRGTAFNSGLVALQERLEAIGSVKSGPITSSAAICTAALAVRCKAIDQLLSSANNNNHDGDRLAFLRVLCNVPTEIEACSELTVTSAAQELLPHVERVLTIVFTEIQKSDKPQQELVAAQSLLSWTKTCRLTISQIAPLIPFLMGLLSSLRSSVAIASAHSLTEALMVVTDSCSESRQAACRLLLEQYSGMTEVAVTTEDDDVAHAVATLCCTLLNEEVDAIVGHPSGEILPSLLRLQTHRVYQVRMLVLECWLTVQDLPMLDRHDDWKHPFGTSVLETIIPSLAYPRGFVGWHDSEIDESTWHEYRRLVSDVLVSLYVMLRSGYVERMCALLQQQQQDWTVGEVALFALVTTSREINARCLTKPTGTSIGTSITADRCNTAKLVLQIAAHLLQQPWPVQNQIVSDVQANFIGSYSPTWATHCRVQELVQLLQCLNPLLGAGSEAAAIAFRSLIVQSSKTLTTKEPAIALECIQGAWQASVKSSPVRLGVLDPVATGCVRMICQLSQADQLLHDFASPLVQEKGQEAISAIERKTLDDDALASAINQLHTCLRVLQTIIRFSDSNSSLHPTPPIKSLLSNQVGPLLSRLSSLEIAGVILENILSIHEQLLRTVPDLAAAQLSETISWVLSVVFQKHRNHHALSFVASAVETYGARQATVFEPMVPHVMQLVAGQWNPGNTGLAAEFFSLCHRLFLYFPESLMPQLPAALTTAVEFFEQQTQERESSRNCLQFVTAVVSFASLRLDATSRSTLDTHSAALQGLASLEFRVRVAQSCWKLLLEGGMKMLGPPASECLYSVVRTSPSPPATLQQAHPPDLLYQRLCPVLLSFILGDISKKGKAKVLIQDYALMAKGELSEDSLATYELQAT